MLRERPWPHDPPECWRHAHQPDGDPSRSPTPAAPSEPEKASKRRWLVGLWGAAAPPIADASRGHGGSVGVGWRTATALTNAVAGVGWGGQLTRTAEGGRASCCTFSIGFAASGGGSDVPRLCLVPDSWAYSCSEPCHVY